MSIRLTSRSTTWRSSARRRRGRRARPTPRAGDAHRAEPEAEHLEVAADRKGGGGHGWQRIGRRAHAVGRRAYDPHMARALPALIPLGYGKFVRADRVFALVPLEGPSGATGGGRWCTWRGSRSRSSPRARRARSRATWPARWVGPAGRGRAWTCPARRRCSDEFEAFSYRALDECSIERAGAEVDDADRRANSLCPPGAYADTK